MQSIKYSARAEIDQWAFPSINAAKVSKWRWLWQQFLCCLRLSKKPYILLGIDPSSPDGDFSVKVWGMVSNDGYFEISHIEQAE